MSDLDSLRHVLDRMGRSVVPVDDDEAARALRERTLPKLDAIIRTRATRRRAGRRVFWLAVALLPLVPTATWALRDLGTVEDRAGFEAAVIADRGSAQVVSGSGAVSLVAGERTRVSVGDRIETLPAGAAHLSLSMAHVAINGDSQVRLDALDGSKEAVHVGRGLVSVTVQKLGPARAFAMTTTDSRIVVHGTAFTVQVSEWTSVAVSSGVVEVVHGGRAVWLRAGEQWSSRPAPEAPAAQALTPGERIEPVTAGVNGTERGVTAAPARVTLDAPPRPHRSDESGKRSTSGETPREAPSRPAPEGGRALADETLAIQNDLFRSAIRARHQGRAEDALALLDRLIIEHPSAPILHEARVEQMRWRVHAGDRVAAAQAARRYLSLYPDGFAAAEARALLD